MLDLRLFCGENEALKWLKKLVNTKEVLLTICLQGTKSSVRKSVISWCKKVVTTSRLFCLKLDSGYFEPLKFLKFSQFL